MVKAAAKPKLSLWEDMVSKGIASGITDEINDLQSSISKKETVIKRKEEMTERIRNEVESLRCEVEIEKVRIQFFEIVKVRYLSKSQKSS